MGSVPNERKEILMRDPIRWFKCKLKPPKNWRSFKILNCFEVSYLDLLKWILAQISLDSNDLFWQKKLHQAKSGVISFLGVGSGEFKNQSCSEWSETHIGFEYFWNLTKFFEIRKKYAWVVTTNQPTSHTYASDQISSCTQRDGVNKNIIFT